MQEPGRPEAPELAVDYFDGHTARAHAVRVRVRATALHIRGDGVARAVPLAEVQWPERTEGGPRVAHLKDGGALHGRDGAAWDAWARASGLRESRVVTLQQSWRWTLVAAVLLLVMGWAGYRWGLPAVAQATVALVPPRVDAAIGDAVFSSIEANWLRPSTLPPEQQARLRAAFERAEAAAFPAGRRIPWQLHFRSGRMGPNAFALPGGHMVMTDELVRLVEGREDVIVGVLAHELGHVRQRHGLRMVVQATVIGAVSSLAFGDFSGLLATAPALLGTAAYSREAEREADAESVEVLRAAGISPAVMVVLFEKLAGVKAGHGGAASAPAGQPAPRAGDDDDGGLGIAFSSHPADAERIRYFREAAGPAR